jgi:hypothetical protein
MHNGPCVVRNSECDGVTNFIEVTLSSRGDILPQNVNMVITIRSRLLVEISKSVDHFVHSSSLVNASVELQVQLLRGFIKCSNVKQGTMTYYIPSKLAIQAKPYLASSKSSYVRPAATAVSSSNNVDIISLWVTGPILDWDAQD